MLESNQTRVVNVVGDKTHERGFCKTTESSSYCSFPLHTEYLNKLSISGILL